LEGGGGQTPKCANGEEWGQRGKSEERPKGRESTRDFLQMYMGALRTPPLTNFKWNIPKKI